MSTGSGRLARALPLAFALLRQAFVFLIQQTSYLLRKLQEFIRILLDGRLCAQFAPAFASCPLHQGKYLLGQDTNQHQGRKGLFHP
jgi:hypothetical protein